MSLYLDCGDHRQIEPLLQRFRFLSGVTTNPALIARGSLQDLELLRTLRRETALPLWAQVRLGSVDQMKHHAYDLFNAAGENVVLKVPFCDEGLQLIRDLASSFKTCVTSVATPLQGFVGAELGARFIAMYVGRIEDRHGLDAGFEAVASLSRLLLARGMRARILAASIREPAWIARLLEMPNVDVTVPPELLTRALEDPVTQAALGQFRALEGREG